MDLVIFEELKKHRPLFPAPGWRMIQTSIQKRGKDNQPYLSVMELQVVGFERDDEGELRLSIWSTDKNTTWWLPEEYEEKEDEFSYGTYFWVFTPGAGRGTFEEWKTSITETEMDEVKRLREEAT